MALRSSSKSATEVLGMYTVGINCCITRESEQWDYVNTAENPITELHLSGRLSGGIQFAFSPSPPFSLPVPTLETVDGPLENFSQANQQSQPPSPGHVVVADHDSASGGPSSFRGWSGYVVSVRLYPFSALARERPSFVPAHGHQRLRNPQSARSCPRPLPILPQWPTLPVRHGNSQVRV